MAALYYNPPTFAEQQIVIHLGDLVSLDLPRGGKWYQMMLPWNVYKEPEKWSIPCLKSSSESIFTFWGVSTQITFSSSQSSRKDLIEKTIVFPAGVIKKHPFCWGSSLISNSAGNFEGFPPKNNGWSLGLVSFYDPCFQQLGLPQHSWPENHQTVFP